MRINTERLTLRQLTLDDMDFLYGLYGHSSVYYYNQDKAPSKEETFERYSKRINAMNEKPDNKQILLITTLADGVPLGEVHMQKNWDESREWEIGFYLHPDYWGKGYAAEAVKALIRHIFEERNGHKIVGYCNANNVRSARLMERVGMRKDGVKREVHFWLDKWCDYFEYSILDREYSDLVSDA